jgi:hypothetical protein
VKYFTPELITRGRSQDDVILDQVERLWDEAGERYRLYYQTIETRLPAGLRQMQDDYYLHDADVLGIGRQRDSFVIMLRLDAPPRDLLLLTYDLAGEPVLDQEALPPLVRGKGRVEWLYDEVEWVGSDAVCCRHCILLSNGWEVQLPLGDVQVSQLQPLFPWPQRVPLSTPSAS